MAEMELDGGASRRQAERKVRSAACQVSATGHKKKKKKKKKTPPQGGQIEGGHGPAPERSRRRVVERASAFRRQLVSPGSPHPPGVPAGSQGRWGPTQLLELQARSSKP